MSYWQRSVFREGRPVFGQVCTWLLLLFALALSLVPFEYQSYPRSSTPATVLSFLPEPLLRSTLLMNLLRCTLFVSAVLWALRRCLPVSCWLVVVSFTCVWSLRMENTIHGAHIFNVTNWLLVIHAAWFQIYRSEIRQAIRYRRFWSSNVYPAWVTFLSVFFLGWFHTAAGLSKLSASGLSWADGTSLQIWVAMFGWQASPFAQLVLSDSRLAQLLQAAALLIELTALLCIVNRQLRCLVGCLLLCFYIGVLTTFVDFGFHLNALLVALFLLPCDRWIERWFESRTIPSS